MHVALPFSLCFSILLGLWVYFFHHSYGPWSSEPRNHPYFVCQHSTSLYACLQDEQLQIAVGLLDYVLQCYNATLLVLPFKFYVVLLLLLYIYIWMLCWNFVSLTKKIYVCFITVACLIGAWRGQYGCATLLNRTCGTITVSLLHNRSIIMELDIFHQIL
jgi:hypothetical protein